MTETETKLELPSVSWPSPPEPAALPAVRQERTPRRPAQPRPAAFPGVIAKAILAITKEIGVVQKSGFNEFLKYKYTRWEEINDKLSPLLAEHGLIIVQSEISRNLLEDNDKGSVLAIVYHFTLVHESGEQWPPVEWTAIARLRDQKGITDDKAASKCHTSAEKQFCIKQFKIRSDENIIDDEGERRPQRVADERATYQGFLDELSELVTPLEFDQWKKENLDRVRGALRDTWLGYFNVAWKERREKAVQAALKMPGYLDEPIDEETGEIDAP